MPVNQNADISVRLGAAGAGPGYGAGTLGVGMLDVGDVPEDFFERDFIFNQTI